MLKKIETLVQTCGHCVLATCGPGAWERSCQEGGAGSGKGPCEDEGVEPCAPHASLMSYCAATDCTEFWLATHTATRKFRNLSANPRASLLIDDRDAPGCPTREAAGLAGAAGADGLAGAEEACGAGAAPGLALTVAARHVPFATPQEEAAARRALLEKHPQLASFLALEGVVLLRLRVESLQLLSGLTDVFFIKAEKMLDARTRRA